MTRDEFRDFAELWFATRELYPGQAPTNQAIELAFAALERYEISDVRAALSAHVRDPDVGQYAPKPADIVRHITGTGSEQGQAAWAKLERSMRSVGQYETVAFDDPLIHVIVDEMGGWPSLCRTDEDELPFRRAEFVKRYGALRRQGVHTWPARLVGVHETENRAHGYVERVPETVLIGNQSTAQATLEHGGAGRDLQISNAPQTLGNVAARLARPDEAPE